MPPGDSRVREIPGQDGQPSTFGVPENLQCKTAPEKEFWTAQKLLALKTEIQLKQIEVDPKKYNIPKTPIGSDSVDVILRKIFAAQGKQVPAGLSAEMTAVARQKIPADAQSVPATSWEMSDGRLIWWTPQPDGSEGELFSVNLLPWQSLASLEAKEIGDPNFYDLGVYRGGTNKPQAGEAGRYEGGVDATAHTDRLRTLDWYIEKSNAADTMLHIFNAQPARFDAATKALINSHLAELTALGNMSRRLAGAPAPTAESFRREFEGKFSKAKILGANGVYNLVLAFQRIADEYPLAVEISQDTTVLTLTIGRDVENGKERFSKAYEKLPNSDIRFCPPVTANSVPAPAPAAQEQGSTAVVPPAAKQPQEEVKPEQKPDEPAEVTPATIGNVMKELDEMGKKYGVDFTYWDDQDSDYDWSQVRECIPNIEAALKAIGTDKLKGAPTLVLSKQKGWSSAWTPDRYGLQLNSQNRMFLEFDYDDSASDIQEEIEEGLTRFRKIEKVVSELDRIGKDTGVKLGYWGQLSSGYDLDRVVKNLPAIEYAVNKTAPKIKKIQLPPDFIVAEYNTAPTKSIVTSDSSNQKCIQLFYGRSAAQLEQDILNGLRELGYTVGE